jgi:hypothetical protein
MTGPTNQNGSCCHTIHASVSDPHGGETGAFTLVVCGDMVSVEQQPRTTTVLGLLNDSGKVRAQHLRLYGSSACNSTMIVLLAVLRYAVSIMRGSLSPGTKCEDEYYLHGDVRGL